MPKVPYDPVPQEKPSNFGIPSVRVDAPLGAFGGDTAKAMQGLGGQIEKTSDVLFERAMDLQKLKNDSEAKEADAKYMEKAGLMHAEFGSLAGKAAVDAYPKYIKDLQAARTEIRNGLSNEYTRKLYDGPSLSTYGRTVFNGAGHAATENKKYAIGASQARIDAANEDAFQNPRDELAFKRGGRLGEEEIKDKAALAGLGPEQTEQAIQRNNSGRLVKRLTGLARTAPFEAATMLEENKKNMLEADYLKADNIIRGQSRAVGSVGLANEVYVAGQETPTQSAKPLAQMEEEVRQRAEKLDPKDPILANHAVTALRGLYNQSKYAQRQEQIANEQTVNTAIQGGVRDIQQLRTDPKVAAAIDALDPKVQLGIPARINNYNAAVSKVTNQDTYNRLYGLSNNNVEEFLNIDITKESLSQQDMRKLQEVQRKLKDLPNADPRVNRAMTQIRGALGSQLEALGVYKRTDGNKEDYDRLTGAVQGALDVWQEAHGKAASYKDVAETIGPQIIRQITEPGWLWGTNKVPFFKQSVPNEFVEEAKKHTTANDMPDYSPEQLQKMFIRKQFMRLYGKKE